MKRKLFLDNKKNTLNHNLHILQESLRMECKPTIIQRGEDIEEYEPSIDEDYAEYLISMLELLKTKDKKYSGINKQKGQRIKDTFNDKEYISMREAERKTGLNIAQIKYSIDNNVGLQKSYKFEVIEDEDN